MPLPTDDLIIWASSDVNLPNLAGPNKVKPIDDLILKGWDFKQKPAADEFNYVLNNLGMHVSYLEESKTYTFSGDVTGTATSTGSDDVTFNVSVTDNSHNHISANISDATSIATANTVIKRDPSGNFSAGTITANLAGNSTSTDKWKVARTLTASGNSTGSVAIDGSGDVSLNLTTQSISNAISVLTGTIAHGGTIPLPSGYSQAQCHWFVSINEQITAMSTDGADDHAYLKCYADSNRLVYAYISTKDSPTSVNATGTANYIIIGVK